jgi:iron(III) transport system ATP-binding protein
MKSALLVEQLSKRFGKRAVVDAVDFTVAPGEVLALLGPSGSGKSTTLRLIAGLEEPSGGRIEIGGEVVSAPGRVLPPEARRVGFVFQSFALFPHLSVEDNVGFGTRDRGRVDELLRLVALEARRGARVHTLSGGEPFANLDAALRRRVRDEVALALRARHATAVLVTHDASEAFALADRVAVMSEGTILQLGTPEQIYSRFVSLDIGRRTGELVELRGEASGEFARCALGSLPLTRPTHGPCTLALRPEQLRVSSSGVGARVRRRIFEGASTALVLELAGESLLLRVAGPLVVGEGEEVPIGVVGPALAFPA